MLNLDDGGDVRGSKSEHFDVKEVGNGRAKHYVIDVRNTRRECPGFFKRGDHLTVNIEGRGSLLVLRGSEYTIREIRGHGGTIDAQGYKVSVLNRSASVQLLLNGTPQLL